MRTRWAPYFKHTRWSVLLAVLLLTAQAHPTGAVRSLRHRIGGANALVCVRAELLERAEGAQITYTASTPFSQRSASNRPIRAICRMTPRRPSPTRRPRTRSTRARSASSGTKVRARAPFSDVFAVARCAWVTAALPT